MIAARRPGLGILLAVSIAFSGPWLARAQSVPVQWSGIDRVVAFADVHGAYAELLPLLRETGIVDAQDHWAAGQAHLVSLGDLLDRGADSRKVMDLLMRLQGEAQAKGGQVHVLLGNHEAMNILGDLRYVDVRRIRLIRRPGIACRTRGTAPGLGDGERRRIRRSLRPEVPARVFRAPRGFFAQGQVRPVAVVTARGDRAQRHAVHARADPRLPCAA